MQNNILMYRIDLQHWINLMLESDIREVFQDINNGKIKYYLNRKYLNIKNNNYFFLQRNEI